MVTRQSPFSSSTAQHGRFPAGPVDDVDMDKVAREAMQPRYSTDVPAKAFAEGDVVIEGAGSAPEPPRRSLQSAHSKSLAFLVADGLQPPMDDTSSSSSPSSGPGSSEMSGEVHVSIQGAGGKAGNGSHILDPIPADSQLVLSFHHISGWVPLLPGKKPGLLATMNSMLRNRKKLQGSHAAANGQSPGHGHPTAVDVELGGKLPAKDPDTKTMVLDDGHQGHDSDKGTCKDRAQDKTGSGHGARVAGAGAGVGAGAGAGVGAAGAAADGGSKVRRQVLYNISGRVNPGELLALMGPSGSGKTTLLSVIGGRTPKLMKRTGQVLVNGVPFTKTTRRQIGFVLQDDVLYESLTVQETLTYAAALRLPGHVSSAEKLARAEVVIGALGLTKTRNTIIGGYFRRGVSGGERKRVSIGQELLINPAILMLDEPTSGLDSTTAMHLITLLRQLAAGGRAILTTIHQPSSRLYEQLDQLLLLSEGHLMYYGNAQLVSDWFQHLGFKLRFGISMSDFILDVAQGEVSSGERSGHDAIKALCATYERWYEQNPEGFQDTKALATLGLEDPGMVEKEGSYRGIRKSEMDADKAARDANSTRSSRGALGDSLTSLIHSFRRHDSKASDVATKGAAAPGTHERTGLARLVLGRTPRVGATYLQQIAILMSRCARVRRFEALNVNNLAQLIAVALICGLLWWQRGRENSLEAANDLLGLIFFEELFLAMRTLFSSLFTFPDEFRMLTKERASGMYQVSAYYFARTLADLPFEMLFSTIFVAIVYFFGGMRLTAVAFFANLFTMLLVVLVAQSWGLLLGGSFMNPKQAQTVTTVIMLGFLLVGGFYVRDIPYWIDWVKYLSFLYWGYNLLIKIEFSGRSLVDCSSGRCVEINDLQSTLRLPADPDSSPALDAGMLVLMLVVLRVGIYLVLRKKTASLGAK